MSGFRGKTSSLAVLANMWRHGGPYGKFLLIMGAIGAILIAIMIVKDGFLQ